MSSRDSQVTRRSRRIDTEVGINRPAACIRGSVAARQLVAVIEALRVRNPARRQRPGGVGVDRHQRRAPREAVGQVGERRRVEASEVQLGGRRARSEREPHDLTPARLPKPETTSSVVHE